MCRYVGMGSVFFITCLINRVHYGKRVLVTPRYQQKILKNPQKQNTLPLICFQIFSLNVAFTLWMKRSIQTILNLL